MALAWDSPRPDEGKSVMAKFNLTNSTGGKGGELNVFSARGLKLCDRVW